MEVELKKIRGHFNGTQASVAKLLEAIESTFADHKAELSSPTAYFLALTSTLEAISSVSSSSKPNLTPTMTINQTQNDAFYLLSMIISFMPQPVIKSKRQAILELIQPRLNELIQLHQQDRQHQINSIKALISILLPVYFTYSDTELESDHIFKLILKSILPLTLAPQPKLRRSTQGFLTSLINHPDHPLSRPLSQSVISFTTQQLQQLLLSHNQSPSDLSNTLIISLINFIQSFVQRFSSNQITTLISILLNLPKQTYHPFLTSTILNTLEAILDPSAQLDYHTVLSTLKNILNLSPKDERCLPAWLNALKNGWVTLARFSPSVCSSELPKIGKLDELFELFSSEHSSVRLALRDLFVGICRNSLTDQEIQVCHDQPDSDIQALKLDKSTSSTLQFMLKSLFVGLNSTELIANNSTLEILEVLNALIFRLRVRPRTSSKLPTGAAFAVKLLKPHIILLDSLRSNHLGLRTSIDQTLSKFSESCGPKYLLEILPLNLLDQSSSNGRAWLLTVLKVFNTELGHFIKYFVPLSEQLFEKKRQALINSTTQKDQSGGLMEVKIYDTLIDQVWKLLPGYCDLPVDLVNAFDRHFAELLTQIIYSQAQLRPVILNSLKILIDKNLTLAENQAKSDSWDHSEFGFNPTTHLNHLKQFSSNFLSVLFNVYNREQSNQKNSNRGYIVDCIKSFLEILPEQDLNNTYNKVKAMLDKSLANTAKPEITKQFLDILLILLPKLISSSSATLISIGQLQILLTNEKLLAHQELNIQKSSFKLLTKFVESIVINGKTDLIEDLDGFLDHIISPENLKIAASSKRDRALLLSASITLIPSTKLHFIPKLLTELVLGCKESNSDTRVLSYETLIKIGHKIINLSAGSKLDWSAFTGEEMAVDQQPSEVNLEEYFKMISAGLAGQSPHMISATISALSRALFEFHDQLNPTTIAELISMIQIFLTSSNREISKSAMGFIKVSITVLPKPMIESELSTLVPNLLMWTNEHKNFFKANLTNLFQKLIKKYGFDLIESYVPSTETEGSGSRKFLNGLKKKMNKNKKKKANKKENGIAEEASDEEPQEPNRIKLNNAYEEVLYGSSGSEDDESSKESEQKNSSSNQNKNQSKKNKKGNLDSKIMIEDEDDEIMDLLGGPSRITNRAIAGKLAKADKKKQELSRQFKNNSESGKLMITESGPSPKPNPVLSSTNAYLEAINGEDGFKRDSKGRVKFNKSKRNHQSLEQDDPFESVEKDLNNLNFDNHETDKNKNKKVKRVKEKLGAEFKAKKAGGDLIKKTKDGQTLKPFGYLPLSKLSGKGKRQGAMKDINITGKK